MPMMVLAGSSSVIFLVLYGLLHAGRLPGERPQIYAVMVAALVLANSLVHLHLVGEPRDTTNLLLFMVGAGFLLLSTRWLLACLAVTLAGWVLVAIEHPPFDPWGRFLFALVSASVLSLLVHIVRRPDRDRVRAAARRPRAPGDRADPDAGVRAQPAADAGRQPARRRVREGHRRPLSPGQRGAPPPAGPGFERGARPPHRHRHGARRLGAARGRRGPRGHRERDAGPRSRAGNPARHRPRPARHQQGAGLRARRRRRRAGRRDPGRDHDPRSRGGAAHHRSAAAGDAEAGESRRAGRRHRARLQQPADRRPGQHQPGAPPARQPGRDLVASGRHRDVGDARGRPLPADAGLRRQGPLPRAAPRSRGADHRHAAAAEALGGEGRVAARGHRPGAAGDVRRSDADAAGGAQPRDQRVRRDRGHRHHRDPPVRRRLGREHAQRAGPADRARRAGRTTWSSRSATAAAA